MVTNREIFFYSSAKSPIFKHSVLDFIVTSRHYGFSTHHFSSLNLGYHVGDTYKDVAKNRRKIHNLFYPQKPLLWLNQTHSDKIVIYPKLGKPFYQEGDSIVCNHRKIKAMIMVADCIPICLFDVKNNVFALIHAGRMGILKKIITKTINKMSNLFFTKSENLLAYLGPCIHQNYYEINTDIAYEFKHVFGNSVKRFILEHDHHFFLDLPTIAKSQLLESHIPDANIEVSPTCTFDEKNLFSYRKNSKTGRFALIASLK